MPEPGTYQTRISDYRDVDRLDGDATLAAYGELYGRVQRQLFAAFAAGRSVTSLAGLGHAVSYRFKRDDTGWRVLATTDMAEVPVAADRRHGVIGVDLNAGHLAVAEADASGNYTNSWRVPLVTCGKSQRQAEAIIGDAVGRVG